MTRIYLIRHGETEWNQVRRYQGHSDVSLSEKGRDQAKRLVSRLANEKIERVYASDLCRAVETANIIAKACNKEVLLESRFRECHFGEWEGLTFSQIEASFPEQIQVWVKTPGRLAVPGGESFSVVQQRAYAALLELVEKHEGEGVAVVAHGGTIRTLLCAILDVDLDRAWQFRQDNTALNTIEFHEGRGIVERINDTTHLIPGAFPNGEIGVE